METVKYKLFTMRNLLFHSQAQIMLVLLIVNINNYFHLLKHCYLLKFELYFIIN